MLIIIPGEQQVRVACCLGVLQEGADQQFHSLGTRKIIQTMRQFAMEKKQCIGFSFAIILVGDAWVCVCVGGASV